MWPFKYNDSFDARLRRGARHLATPVDHGAAVTSAVGGDARDRVRARVVRASATSGVSVSPTAAPARVAAAAATAVIARTAASPEAAAICVLAV